MTNQEFEKVWATEGTPIFRTKTHRALIPGQAEYAGEVYYMGLWTPIDAMVCGDPIYFIRDENTTKEMELDESWVGLNVEDIEFTGKYYKWAWKTMNPGWI